MQELGTEQTSAELYLELMKRCLLNSIYQDSGKQVGVYSQQSRKLLEMKGAWSRRVVQFFAGWWVRTRRYRDFDPQIRREGRDWPETAHTMIGELRMENIQQCMEEALKNNVPGDVIETGVWRGGVTIFMRAILKAYGVRDRRVWVADSFAGLPRANPKLYAADTADRCHTYRDLAVSMETVQENFRRYGLLDDQVSFLKGWFCDTLPSAPIEQLAVIRLDGDMYESTMDALVHLYPKLSAGGYVIVDDFNAIPACRQAVHDFRDEHGITDPIQEIDWGGVFWKRAAC